jgi:3-phosphoshikimate 1-carboxyvinyltransferase
MKTITVRKADKVLKGKILLPFSKSISNRLLIINALSEKKFSINNLSESGDTILLTNLLAGIDAVTDHKYPTELDTKNAGTAMRFLTAYLSVFKGKWLLTGSERMKQRPVGPLVEALRSLGADIEYLGKLGYPPLLIHGKPLAGGEISVDAGVSSQFISALMLVAPRISGGLILHLKGTAVSRPYLDMTSKLLHYFGVKIKKDSSRIIIPETSLQSKDFTVEADWSSASFWYECAALADEAEITLPGLTRNSLQGDSVLASIYQNFGVTTEFLDDAVRLTKVKKKIDGFYFHFRDYPDIAPPVITTCAAIGIRGRFEGLKSLKIKETDRFSALQNEFEKFGITVETEIESDGDLTMELPPSRLKPVPDLRISTYEDHRMAMTFAPLALRTGKILIENPDIVKKSYPEFWEHLISVGFVIE